MTEFLLDLSHHQTEPDWDGLIRAGIVGVILKAGEGDSYVDPTFAPRLKVAQAKGLITAAYWYIRSGASAAAQVDDIRRVVPPGTPVITDTEDGSGNVALTKDIQNRLRAAGYPVPLSYLPRWYWQQLGSPDLRGLAPLWSSRYPDTKQGDFRAEYSDAPASYWIGYGGLDVALLQFTSSALVNGRGPYDANAFRGTRDQLAALLRGGGGSSTGGGSAVTPLVVLEN